MVADSVIARLQADEQNSATSGLVEAKEELGQVEVYVDRSLSMQPYALAEQTIYDEVLSTFDNFIASEVSFYGFGYQQREDSIQTVELTSAQQLMRSDAYTYANNDYASLLERFSPGNSTYVIITDGVQSDPTDGARLSLVADRLHKWVSRGGALAVLLYRTPYRGQYYSDLIGTDPRYSCEDRPLVLFVLAPSIGAVNDLVTRLNDGPVLDYMVRAGGKDAELFPVEQMLIAAGQRDGLRVMRDMQAFHGINRYAPIYTGLVDTKVTRRLEDAYGYVPLQVQVGVDLREEPWRTLGPERSQEFLERSEIEVLAWRIDRNIPVQPPDSSEEKTPLLEMVQLNQEDARVEKIGPQGDSLVVRYTVPLRRPEEDSRHRRYALLVRLRPSEQNARELIPESFTTDNDLDPSACSQTLRLRQLVGTIMLRNYIPAQTLVLTDWR